MKDKSDNKFADSGFFFFKGKYPDKGDETATLQYTIRRIGFKW